jgi:hypothetical protein
MFVGVTRATRVVHTLCTKRQLVEQLIQKMVIFFLLLPYPVQVYVKTTDISGCKIVINTMPRYTDYSCPLANVFNFVSEGICRIEVKGVANEAIKTKWEKRKKKIKGE